MINRYDSLESHGISVPDWITSDITIDVVDQIKAHGCESGVYMPAVTYSHAKATMNVHGSDVIDYLDNIGFDSITLDPTEETWEIFLSRVLVIAVECWAATVDTEELLNEC